MVCLHSGNQSPGPDVIPNWILWDIAPLISGPLCAIFNGSVHTRRYWICQKYKFISFALIGVYVDNTCAGHCDMRSQWHTVLSDAYEKKCKVLMAMGHYTPAIHFGRLSVVLDTGMFTLDVLLVSYSQ